MSSESTGRFVDVLMPLPLHATFTYRVPEGMEMPAVGARVIVPFNSRSFNTGIVVGYPVKAPEGFAVKDILLDYPGEGAIVRHPQLKLWQWMADYYLCAPGEVFKAAVPAALKVESNTCVELNPDYEPDENEKPLTPTEARIIQILDHDGSLKISVVESRLKGVHGVQPAIDRLVERGRLIISEKLAERYTSKKIKVVRPAFDTVASAELTDAFAKVKGAAKQEKLLVALIDIIKKRSMTGDATEVTRDELLKVADCQPAILKALVDKELVAVDTIEVNRFAFSGGHTLEFPVLSEVQTRALGEVRRSMDSHPVTLLHGVTSSGKTEIYLHLLRECLEAGRSALFLVPEIALTTQLTKRLQKYLGAKVLVYHSKFSDSERVDIWKRLLSDPTPCVVLGARSAVLLPFRDLGLVIVDEEHESSFKQYDPAPRYNARDVSIVLAGMHGARVVLGSATPSIETYYKAVEGKFGLVSLTERYGNATLPPIRLVDMLLERKRRAVRGALSMTMIQSTRDELARGKQVIFFQPRRGFSPLARCRECAWTPRCERCDVAMTYHRGEGLLVCHYCGSFKALPTVCPQCKEPAIETLGYGTERIEDEIASAFPERRISRLDLDTTRNKSSYEKIITEFSSGKSDVLVGTQMVTKGLDFGGVTLVNVVNADALINLPDFRSAERAYNTLEQVSGRAGRREEKGLVEIQTYTPAHPVFRYLINHDYRGFYEHELEERRRYHYPPFTRIIYVYLKHRDRATVVRAADELTARLRLVFGQRVFGPDKPPVERVNLMYIRRVMLKVETTASMQRVKELLRETYVQLMTLDGMKQLSVYYDVDPD